MASPSIPGRVGSHINTMSGIKTPSLTRIDKKRVLEKKNRQNFVRRYFSDTVMSPDGNESPAVRRVQGTMVNRQKNDSAEHTPPGLSAVRTTTYNIDEKTSMD